LNKKGTMKNKICLKQDDITTFEVDGIVNAANSSLLGGGGVDGAIHRAAGPQLLEECKTLGGCTSGEAKLTKGYNLKAKYVIHTVGPVWKGGYNNEKTLLKNAYHNSLLIAKQNKMTSVAFPNISTGVYGYPKTLAATIAIECVTDFLKNNNLPKTVYFICYDDENFEIYKKILNWD
jgi:O-acetyl-ADP-ribose deacetylase